MITTPTALSLGTAYHAPVNPNWNAKPISPNAMRPEKSITSRTKTNGIEFQWKMNFSLQSPSFLAFKKAFTYANSGRHHSTTAAKSHTATERYNKELMLMLRFAKSEEIFKKIVEYLFMSAPWQLSSENNLFDVALFLHFYLFTVL